jgi:8-oxo-dGTP pyrophosphatase MutT (NUDIX family)
LAQVSINKETQAYKSISFEIPGGKRELLESSEQCAFREFREEVGFALAGDMIDADTRWILIPSHKMKVALVDLDKGRE